MRSYKEKLLNNLLSPVFIILTVVLVYLFSNNIVFSQFNLYITLFISLILIGYLTLVNYEKRSVKIIGYLSILLITYLVASTGWFYSPFFFTLYLTAIVLVFLFNFQVSVVFTFTLVLLFSLNIGQVDLTYDFLVVLSLLSIIPISLYIKKYFIAIKQQQKEILVLKAEGSKKQSNVNELLSNKVNNFSVNIRQALNNIKQYGYTLNNLKDDKKKSKYNQTIIVSCENALQLLNKFEQDVTGTTIKPNK